MSHFRKERVDSNQPGTGIDDVKQEQQLGKPTPRTVNELLTILGNERLLVDWASLPAAQRLRVQLFVRRLDWALDVLTTGQSRELPESHDSDPVQSRSHQMVRMHYSPEAIQPHEDPVGTDEDLAVSRRYEATMRQILLQPTESPAEASSGS